MYAWLNFQLLWKTRKHPATAFRDHHYILLSYSAESRIIQSGLNRQHLSGFQRDLLQTRMVVHLESEPMACPMEESNSPPFAHLRRKTALCEEFLNGLVNRHPVDSRLDLLQGKPLPGFHRFPKFSLRLARSATQNGARHVAEIAGLRVARKNIENNQRVGVERTKAALVRIAGLVAAGDNRAGRNAARAQDCRVNFRAQHF